MSGTFFSLGSGIDHLSKKTDHLLKRPVFTTKKQAVNFLPGGNGVLPSFRKNFIFWGEWPKDLGPYQHPTLPG